MRVEIHRGNLKRGKLRIIDNHIVYKKQKGTGKWMFKPYGDNNTWWDYVTCPTVFSQLESIKSNWRR